MLRVVGVALMNVIPIVTTVFGATYAVQPAYGIGFSKDIYLWIPVLGNIVAVMVIPYVGNLSDKIGRRPPIIVGALGSGLLSYLYLYAISIHNVWLAIATSLLMWGIVYQGYNAIFPSFYPELFPTRTRVSAMAISQNFGTTLTALLPALFAAVAPPGASNIPLTIGTFTLAATAISAYAAWSARENYRVHLNDLGHPDAVPVEKAEYDRMRAQSLADAELTALAGQDVELTTASSTERGPTLEAPCTPPMEGTRMNSCTAIRGREGDVHQDDLSIRRLPVRRDFRRLLARAHRRSFYVAHQVQDPDRARCPERSADVGCLGQADDGSLRAARS